jgi:hypothetical protein
MSQAIPLSANTMVIDRSPPDRSGGLLGADLAGAVQQAMPQHWPSGVPQQHFGGWLAEVLACRARADTPAQLTVIVMLIASRTIMVVRRYRASRRIGSNSLGR